MTTKDICIGKDKWIKWVEFNPTEKELFDIDSLLDETWNFWKLLETECVVECCGIDAFYFGAEDIQKALTDFDNLNLVKQMRLLKREIQGNHCSIIISSKFNNLFDKSVFTQLLEHILKTLTENLSLGEKYEYKRTNFIEKTQKNFKFLETEFGFDKPNHTFSVQANGVITSDKIEYKNDLQNKTIIISNAYHPIDYGFDINLVELKNGEKEMLFYVLKEKQDIEQEYLEEYATKLKEEIKRRNQERTLIMRKPKTIL